MKLSIILTSVMLTVSVTSDKQIPNEIDWREKGIITKVKDQGSCKGSFYFAALGLLESYYYKLTGQILDLSEQSALDCSGGYNGGCAGGGVLNTLDFVRTKGVVLEENYPYTGTVGDCQMDSSQSILKNIGYELLSRDEEIIKARVGTIGPVAVTFNAENLDSYSGGLYSDLSCSTSKSANSGIIVGYGTTANDEDYWIVKMSFGTNWGENGYIRIATDVGKQCGIIDNVIYAIL